MAESDQYHLGTQDSGSDVTEFNLLDYLIEQKLKDRVVVADLVRVKKASNTPGQVTKTGTVSVLPMVAQVDGYGQTTPHEQVHGLPVHRHQGGKNAVIIDPEVGDIGIVVYPHRDTSVVKKTYAEGGPGSRRTMSMADGVYIGLALANNDKTPEQYVAFQGDGILQVDKHGNTVHTNDDGVTILDKHGQKIEMRADGVHFTTSQVTVNGEVVAKFGTSGAVKVSTHDHSAVQPGSGVTGPPVPGS